MSRCLEAFNACAPAARNTDLSMAEALRDPLIRTLMDADGVDPEALEFEFTRIAEARETHIEA